MHPEEPAADLLPQVAKISKLNNRKRNPLFTLNGKKGVLLCGNLEDGIV